MQEAKRANDRVMAPEVVALRGKKEMRVAHCLGSSEQPMSDRQLEDKFRSQCQAVLGKQRTEAALEMLARLDEVQDLRIAASALVP